MKKIIFIILLIFTSESLADSVFDKLRNDKKTSYLDFILLKIENRLIQRHSLLSSQLFALRVQYQSIGTQVDFVSEKSKIVISITGIMDKARYEQKKYKPKISANIYINK